MDDIELERKAYGRLLEWKTRSEGRTAVLVTGARRTGKSHLVRRFASEQYRSHILIDFMRVSRSIRDTFENDAYDLDLLFNKISLEFGVELFPRESAIVFDEVELFPRARELIKVFVEDGRYDFIETGSLLSIRTNTADILIPSEEEEIELNPLDFEEFLWALGDHASMNLLRGFYGRREAVGQGAHRRMMNLFREYVLVGGMPEPVKTYVRTKDFRRTDEAKKTILKLYREDCSKYAGSDGSRVRGLFDGIPSMLNKKDRAFKPPSPAQRAGSRGPDESFLWLCDSRIANACLNATDPSAGLAMSTDDARMKLYMADTGLLVTHSIAGLDLDPDGTYSMLLSDRLGINEGMFMENAVAQMLVANGRRLFFYAERDGGSRTVMEVDFLIVDGGKVRPVEVKSSGTTKHVSLDKFRDKFGRRIGQAVILCTKDLEERDGILYMPLYMAPLLRRPAVGRNGQGPQACGPVLRLRSEISMPPYLSLYSARSLASPTNGDSLFSPPRCRQLFTAMTGP